MTFEGFRGREDGRHYTMIGNEFFDSLLSKLSGTEIKILMVIFRNTYGFIEGMNANGDVVYRQEYVVTTQKLAEQTGVLKQTVIVTLQKLIEKGYIVKTEYPKKKTGYRICTTEDSKTEANT